MKRLILYLFAVIAGFILSIGLFLHWASSDFEYANPEKVLCFGINREDVLNQNQDDSSQIDSGGLPFRYKKVTHFKENGCLPTLVAHGRFYEQHRILVEYLYSWQFYANWAVCTLPFLGAAYLYNKKYANTRH